MWREWAAEKKKKVEKSVAAAGEAAAEKLTCKEDTQSNIFFCVFVKLQKGV